MPIPPPDVRPDLYDYQDCRPGPSTYPAADAAELRETLRQRLLANPKLRHLAERLGPPADTLESAERPATSDK